MRLEIRPASQVPRFIGTGEKIKINTGDGAYIERA